MGGSGVLLRNSGFEVDVYYSVAFKLILELKDTVWYFNIVLVIWFSEKVLNT